MSKQLTEFLELKKQRLDREPVIDWNKRVDDYKAAVRSLNSSIEKWLSDPIQKGIVALHRHEKALDEGHTAPYLVEELWLQLGDEKVYFSPVGTDVYGAQGRIDVRGEAGESMFLYYQADAQWVVVLSRAPTLTTETLDEESFDRTIQAVMRQ